MTWEQCRAFGVIKIDLINRAIYLRSNLWNRIIIQVPGYEKIAESAQWQGKNLKVKAYNPHH